MPRECKVPYHSEKQVHGKYLLPKTAIFISLSPQDVILQAHKNGIVLKSAATSGNIMTRCLIRRDFFADNSFQIVLKNPEDIEASTRPDSGHENKTLIEFCLPFTELKHIVEGMVEEENSIELAYPVGDSMLEIRIPEESKGI